MAPALQQHGLVRPGPLFLVHAPAPGEVLVDDLLARHQLRRNVAGLGLLLHHGLDALELGLVLGEVHQPADGLWPALGVALLGGGDDVQHPLAVDLDLDGREPQLVEIPQRPGPALRHLEQVQLLDHEVEGEIPAHRLLLAPGGQLTQDGQLAATQLPGVDDLEISLAGIAALGLAGGVVLALLLEPGELAALTQLAHHLGVEGHQIEDVGGCVFQLTRGERTSQPVGTGLILLELDPEKLVDQGAKAHRNTMAQEGCRQLGVVHLVRQMARLMLDKLKILAGGVQNGDLPCPAETLPQSGEIERQGIQQGETLAVIDLEQTELGIVGTGANEFGIDGQGNVGQRSEILIQFGLL